MSWLDDMTGTRPGFWWDEPGTGTGPEKGTSAYAEPVTKISWDWRIGLIYERESSVENIMTGEVAKRRQPTMTGHKNLIEWLDGLLPPQATEYQPPPVIDPPGRKRSTWDIYRAELRAMRGEPRYFDIYSENTLTPQLQATLLREQDPYGYQRWTAGLRDDRLWKVLLNWLRTDCMNQYSGCSPGEGASLGGLAIILKATLGTKLLWMFVGRNMGGTEAVNAHVDGMIREDIAFWDSLTFLPFSNPLDFSITVPRLGLIREEGKGVRTEPPVQKAMMSYADYIRAMNNIVPATGGGSLPPYDIWKELHYGLSCPFWPEKVRRSKIRFLLKKVRKIQEEVLPKRRRRRKKTMWRVMWPGGGRVKPSKPAKPAKTWAKKKGGSKGAEGAEGMGGAERAWGSR